MWRKYPEKGGILGRVERRVFSSLVLFVLEGSKGWGVSESLEWVVGVDG